MKIFGIWIVVDPFKCFFDEGDFFSESCNFSISKAKINQQIEENCDFTDHGQMKTEILDQSDGWDSNGQQHPLQLGNAFPQISEFNFPNSNASTSYVIQQTRGFKCVASSNERISLEGEPPYSTQAVAGEVLQQENLFTN